MEIWRIVWMVVLIIGFLGFLVISAKVIYKGFAEMRDLLKGLDE